MTTIINDYDASDNWFVNVKKVSWEQRLTSLRVSLQPAGTENRGSFCVCELPELFLFVFLTPRGKMSDKNEPVMTMKYLSQRGRCLQHI